MSLYKLNVINKNTNLYSALYIHLFAIKEKRSKNWLPNKYRFRPFSSLVLRPMYVTPLIPTLCDLNVQLFITKFGIKNMSLFYVQNWQQRKIKEIIEPVTFKISKSIFAFVHRKKQEIDFFKKKTRFQAYARLVFFINPIFETRARNQFFIYPASSKRALSCMLPPFCYIDALEHLQYIPLWTLYLTLYLSIHKY
jgi:hypothetical protein